MNENLTNNQANAGPNGNAQSSVTGGWDDVVEVTVDVAVDLVSNLLMAAVDS